MATQVRVWLMLGFDAEYLRDSLQAIGLNHLVSTFLFIFLDCSIFNAFSQRWCYKAVYWKVTV